ncbi:MAG: AraC family transcriptional regulator, partial [Eubacteriales bacterium]|nr:AraC family transcriptional regulator [Eubacteriales bacterium]
SDETIRGLTPLFVRAFAADLLITMRQRDPLRFSVGVSRKIDSILLYLNQHFTADLTLQSIADRFFLSRDYCNRLFHKSTGMTVMYYVKYSRVLYARQLLADGMSATDAAAKSGFQDYSSFYRAYRRVTGRSPSDDYQVAETASPGA